MGSSDVGRRRREGWRILTLCPDLLMYIHGPRLQGAMALPGDTE